MNKTTLIKKIVAHLRGELEVYTRAAREAHAEATHEQNKAENKYDTRGLEASYLARGQARQVAEIEQSIQQFDTWPVRTWTPDEPIALGALVDLTATGEQSCYFLGPRAGGTEVTHERREVLVLTPQSPLGQQLVGRRQGEEIELLLGNTRKRWRIVSVT